MKSMIESAITIFPIAVFDILNMIVVAVLKIQPMIESTEKTVLKGIASFVFMCVRENKFYELLLLEWHMSRNSEITSSD